MTFDKDQKAELLTEEQMLAELYARASKPVADSIRESRPNGSLPLHAIKKDLRLVPVRAWERLPEDGNSK